MESENFYGILLLGAPGVGKTTQGRLLEERTNHFLHIESGAQLQMFAATFPTDPRTRMIREIFDDDGRLKTHKLLDDVTHASVILSQLQRMQLEDTYRPADHRLILDAVIRTVEQAEIFDDNIIRLEHVIHLDVGQVSDDEMYRRWESRMKPGEDYTTFRRRQAVYKEKTAPLIERYSRKGILTTIDPSGSIYDVYNRVLEATRPRLRSPMGH